MRKIPKKVLGILLAMIFALISLTVYAAEANAANTGWQQSNGKWYYYWDDGRMATGWDYIGSNEYPYYFNENGEMQTGWQYIGCWWYYFNGNGIMQTGWQYIDGSWYYFNEGGQMQTGWQSIGGKTYYFYDNGKMAVSTWVGCYYVDSKGVLSEKDSLILTYQDDGNHLYHTGETIVLRYKISQPEKLKSMHLEASLVSDGCASMSYEIYLSIDSEGNAVFMPSGGDNYLPITGRLDGDILSFSLDTASVSESAMSIFVEASFAKDNGELVTFSYDHGSHGNYAAVSNVCADGKHKLTLEIVQGSSWYICQICGFVKNPYEDLSSCIWTTHGTWMRDSKGWWYKLADSYVSRTDYTKGCGLTTDSTEQIYMGDYVKNQLVFIDGSWYYFNSSGYMQTGWVYYSNSWRYFNGSGALQFGWIKDGSNWYHTDRYGAMQTGWITIGGKWYYLNASGHMVTGWQQISGSWYYFNTSGQMLTGWQAIGGRWYYFNASGVMATGWRQISGSWYYFNTSGHMVTGWQQISGKYYYFNSDGTMAVDTWVGNYYVNSSGVWTTSK